MGAHLRNFAQPRKRWNDLCGLLRWVCIWDLPESADRKKIPRTKALLQPSFGEMRILGKQISLRAQMMVAQSTEMRTLKT